MHKAPRTGSAAVRLFVTAVPGAMSAGELRENFMTIILIIYFVFRRESLQSFKCPACHARLDGGGDDDNPSVLLLSDMSSYLTRQELDVIRHRKAESIEKWKLLPEADASVTNTASSGAKAYRRPGKFSACSMPELNVKQLGSTRLRFFRDMKSQPVPPELILVFP